MASNKTAPPAVSRLLLRVFHLYLERYFRRHFDAVRISRASYEPEIGQGPMVVYANHPSWWDPLVFMLVSRHLLPNRIAYGPMDRSALERYPILKRLGVFGIEQGTAAGATEFLRTSLSVLESPGSVLWLTAEGRFSDPRRRPVVLRLGLAHLVRRIPDLQVLPLAVEYPFWNERLPEVAVRLGAPVVLPEESDRRFRDGHSLLESELERTMDALAEEAQSRDPDYFHTLLLGATGVSGLYDHWRRWVALRRGDSPALSHEVHRR